MFDHLSSGDSIENLSMSNSDKDGATFNAEESVEQLSGTAGSEQLQEAEDTFGEYEIEEEDESSGELLSGIDSNESLG